MYSTTKAYIPAQSAVGELKEFGSVMILYIPELEPTFIKVKEQDLHSFTYHWFTNSDKSSYILQIQWQENLTAAIEFNQQCWSLLAYLIEPRDLILSGVPITEELSLDLNGPIVTCSKMVFSIE